MLPTLYKKNRMWSIGVVTTSDGGAEIHTRHGVVGGKIQHLIRAVPKGRGGRTPHQQAQSEALSAWTDKRDKDGHTENLTSGPLIRPMLAHTYATHGHKIVYPCIGQPKWDGIRCLASFDGDAVLLQSRRGVPFAHLDSIRDRLDHLFRHGGIPPNTYLDGELYSHDIPFEEISGIARTRISNDCDSLFFVVYDCFSVESLSDPYLARLDKIRTWVPPTGTVCLSPSRVIHSAEEVGTAHDLYVSDGFEGLILRNSMSTYELDKRSPHLQKVKRFEDAEFRIVGFKEGDGTDKGLVIWQCEHGDRTFDVRPAGTHSARRAQFLEGDKYVGMFLTVQYQGMTHDGVPRFPVGKAIRMDDV